MESIGTILDGKSISEQNGRKPRERDFLIEQIYVLYESKNEDFLRKKENWKRYVSWLKENRIQHGDQSLKDFKKKRRFIKKMNLRTFGIMINHIPTQDLYYILSVSKDRANRKESIGAYVLTQAPHKEKAPQ